MDENTRPHSLQSTVVVISWVVRSWARAMELRPNTLSQKRQRYMRSRECTTRCCRNVEPSEKLFPHSSQRKGFSPVCVRMWTAREPLVLNTREQPGCVQGREGGGEIGCGKMSGTSTGSAA